MGSEIALVFALAGMDVLLNDTTEESLKRATDNLAKILEKGIARGFYKADEVQWTLGRLRATTDLAAYADRDLVIEAVFESEPVKAEVFRKLDPICKRDCILASNTSTISITALSSYV